MKVKDLIEELKKADGELQVRLVCDHGQIPMSCDRLGVGYITEDSYMPDEIHPDDYAEGEYDGAVTCLMLEG